MDGLGRDNAFEARRRQMTVGTVLLIVLILVLLGVLPT